MINIIIIYKIIYLSIIHKYIKIIKIELIIKNKIYYYFNMNNIKQKRNKPTKKKLYEQERNNIINNLNNIIPFNEDHSVLFDNINNSNELKQYINDNIDNIKKFYACSNWGYFKNNDINEISYLIKKIYKEHSYTIFSKYKTKNINNKHSKITIYYIYPPGTIL
jgi:hypothetical protein